MLFYITGRAGIIREPRDVTIKATVNGSSLRCINQIKLCGQSQLHSFNSVFSEFTNKFILCKRNYHFTNKIISISSKQCQSKLQMKVKITIFGFAPFVYNSIIVYALLPFGMLSKLSYYT